jgi:cytochrome P450
MTLSDTSIDTSPAAFDPRNPAVMQCPFPFHDRLRAEDPVHRMSGDLVGRPGETVYAVTRQDLVSQVLMDWPTFSSKFGSPGSAPPAHLLPQLREIAAGGWDRPPTMLTADPPVHTRYRKLVAQAFTPGRVQALAPTIQRICDDLVTGFTTPQIEFVTQFCVPIPTRTIAAALGVPEQRFPDFKRWADASVATIGRNPGDDEWLEVSRTVVELQQYFAAEFEARKTQPRDDLLTALTQVHLTPEDGIEGGPLSMSELISIVQQLQVAGSETTASLIADAIVLLAGRPDEWDRIAADPSRANPVVEECLRLASPNQGMWRVVTHDTELGGVSIPKGSTMWVLFGAANRDGAAYPEPATFNPDRDHVAQHLAFGRGPHYCIGAPLARLEATIALQTLTRAYKRIEPLHPTSLQYAPSAVLRGLVRLDVGLTPRG